MDTVTLKTKDGRPCVEIDGKEITVLSLSTGDLIDGDSVIRAGDIPCITIVVPVRFGD